MIPRTVTGRASWPATAGRAVWGLLTSVNFAVAQIIFLGLLGVVGMTIRQLPSFAFRSQMPHDGSRRSRTSSPMPS